MIFLLALLVAAILWPEAVRAILSLLASLVVLGVAALAVVGLFIHF